METQTRFTPNADGTVTDRQLNVLWSKTVAISVDGDDSDKALAALGPDWRYATVQEMTSLVDYTREEPAIDTSIFPDTESLPYWTKTPTVWNKSAVWVVRFSNGHVSYLNRSLNACLRAVCELPAGQ